MSTVTATTPTTAALAGVWRELGLWTVNAQGPKPDPTQVPLVQTGFSDLRRLAALSGLVGITAHSANYQDTPDPLALRFYAQRVAVGAVAWLTHFHGGVGDGAIAQVHALVLAEREQQTQLWGLEAYTRFTPCELVTILVEELGEVAREVGQIHWHGYGDRRLITELVQVAAVAVAWLEVLEGALS